MHSYGMIRGMKMWECSDMIQGDEGAGVLMDETGR
jgi:hypothetical protein